MNRKKNDYEERKEYFLDYYEKNKDKLKEIVTCEDCGSEYQKYNKTSHLRTKKHTNAIIIKNLKNDNEQMKKIVNEIYSK